jgi:hypothetical protein
MDQLEWTGPKNPKFSWAWALKLQPEFFALSNKACKKYGLTRKANGHSTEI